MFGRVGMSIWVCKAYSYIAHHRACLRQSAPHQFSSHIGFAVRPKKKFLPPVFILGSDNLGKLFLLFFLFKIFFYSFISMKELLKTIFE